MFIIFDKIKVPDLVFLLLDITKNIINLKVDKAMSMHDPEELIKSEEDLNSLKDKYLTFKVAEEEYGLEVRHIIEIVGIQKITQLPDMPDFIKGVINLRGKVIPVIDIRLRFRLPEQEYGNRTCIIVVSFEESTFGLIVDTVSEVLDIPESQIDAPPRSKFNANNRYIQGIGKVEDMVKILLNVNKLLSDEEISALTDV